MGSSYPHRDVKIMKVFVNTEVRDLIHSSIYSSLSLRSLMSAQRTNISLLSAACTPSNMKHGEKQEIQYFVAFMQIWHFPCRLPQSQLLCWPQIPACVTAEEAAAASVVLRVFIICYQHINTCQIEITHMQSVKVVLLCVPNLWAVYVQSAGWNRWK